MRLKKHLKKGRTRVLILFLCVLIHLIGFAQSINFFEIELDFSSEIIGCPKYDVNMMKYAYKSCMPFDVDSTKITVDTSILDSVYLAGVEVIAVFKKTPATNSYIGDMLISGEYRYLLIKDEDIEIYSNGGDEESPSVFYSINKDGITLVNGEQLSDSVICREDFSEKCSYFKEQVYYTIKKNLEIAFIDSELLCE